MDRGGDKLLECGSCGHRWERDLTPTCTVCGSQDLEAVPTSTLEEAGRGEQRTPSGIRDVYRCWSCGAKDATSATATADPDWLDRRRSSISRFAGTSDLDDEAPADHARRVQSAFGDFGTGAILGGRWRVTRLVDWSSSASLWSATEVTGPRDVMFQLLHPDETAEGDHRKVYVASARAAQLVEHPNLVRVLDVQQRGTDVLIVTSGAGDRTIAEVPLHPVEVQVAGADLASALAAVHGRGLSHLRVRPATVFVTESRRAQLGDFGIGRARARLRAGQYADDDLRWLAPEQILAREHEQAADVYSLALVLWVAAGGDPSALGSTPSAQAKARLDEDLPDLREFVDTVDGRLASALVAAGRRDPSRRPSAEEFAHMVGEPEDT